MTVTLVGDPATAKPLAQALAAAPGVSLELRTPASYRRSDALASDLVVLDRFRAGRWIAPGARRRARRAAVASRAEQVTGTLAAPTVSSSAAGNDLVAGVDLRSLSIDGNAARQARAPRAGSSPCCRAPGDAAAAGDNGRQRVAVLAFDPDDLQPHAAAGVPDPGAQPGAWAGGWTSIRERRLARDQRGAGRDARNGRSRSWAPREASPWAACRPA